MDKNWVITEKETIGNVDEDSELVLNHFFSWISLFFFNWWFLEDNHKGVFFRILKIGRRNFNVEETYTQGKK